MQEKRRVEGFRISDCGFRKRKQVEGRQISNFDCENNNQKELGFRRVKADEEHVRNQLAG